MKKSQKVQYSESEVAAMLGISSEQLRSLVRDHIVKDDVASDSAAVVTYHASDLVVLRILAGMAQRPEVAHA